MSHSTVGRYDVDSEVLRRYKAGANQVEPTLCCPTTDYDGQFLNVLPKEILEKDYGCGDPSKHVRPGETVVDLGSGAGKICYILSQKVGPNGHVIGVDFNDEMLAMARHYQSDIAAKIGYDNVRFVKGKIQDLAIDLEQLEQFIKSQPVDSLEKLHQFETEQNRLIREAPMIADQSIDVVVSNCVLNLVKPQDKQKLFSEIYRVLNFRGRAVISDIVCDETPTPAITNDPELWSGCIAGAFREDQFLTMFEQAGFYGIEILERAAEPWKVIDGIEFRSITLRAHKSKDGPCLERHQAVIYKGPWKQVKDDDGHTLRRGERMAVCDKTFNLYTDSHGPYHHDVEAIVPRLEIPLDTATEFNCRLDAIRDPQQTKGHDYRNTISAENGSPCSHDDHASCCC